MPFGNELLLDQIVQGEIKFAGLRDRHDRLTHGGLLTKQRCVLDATQIDVVSPVAEHDGARGFTADDIRQCAELLDELLGQATTNDALKEFVRRALTGQKSQAEIALEAGINPSTGRSFLRRFRLRHLRPAVSRCS